MRWKKGHSHRVTTVLPFFRTVEHMVDCVLYLENTSEGGLHQLRMLRASKNRFGASDQVGVYQMTAGRLVPVSDPSSLFLAHRNAMQDTEGSAIAIVTEGMRAMTLEVQALVAPVLERGAFGRKTVEGIALPRLQMLMGILQKRCGIRFGSHDVYVNLAGRLRLDRREAGAADLAVAMSLVSSLTNNPIRADTAFCAEVGLLGELRPVSSVEKRVNEARRMGFSRVVTPLVGGRPKNGKTSLSKNYNGVEWIQCDTLREALQKGLVDSLPSRKRMSRKRGTSKAIPGSLEDLGLDEILDDDDDEDLPYS